MSDKTLTCKDWGSKFIFSVGEQEFYQEKGFTNKLTRCISCRRAKKKNKIEDNFRLFKVVVQTTTFFDILA